MGLTTQLRKKIKEHQFEFSRHAVDQSIIRNISVKEIREAFLEEFQIIEDYPEDKYGPSILILGFTKKQRPLHIHCSYPSRSVLKIITLYEPDPNKWINFKRRK